MDTDDIDQARVTAFQVVRAILSQACRACIQAVQRLYQRIFGWRSPTDGEQRWMEQPGHKTVHAWGTMQSMAEMRSCTHACQLAAPDMSDTLHSCSCTQSCRLPSSLRAAALQML